MAEGNERATNQGTAALSLENLDDVEVKILIVAKNPNGMKAAAGFLNRRGWPTNVVGSVNKVIETIVKDKPNFVLISLNHPNPNVLKLPNLLSQSFQINSMAFAESGDAASVAKVNNSKMKYKLAGSASGPNIHRGIRKALIDLYGLNSSGNAESSAGNGGAEDDAGAVAVSGQGSEWEKKQTSRQTVKSESYQMESETIEGKKKFSLSQFAVSGGSDESTSSPDAKAMDLMQLLQGNDEDTSAVFSDNSQDSSTTYVPSSGEEEGSLTSEAKAKPRFPLNAAGENSTNQGSLVILPPPAKKRQGDMVIGPKRSKRQGDSAIGAEDSEYPETDIDGSTKGGRNSFSLDDLQKKRKPNAKAKAAKEGLAAVDHVPGLSALSKSNSTPEQRNVQASLQKLLESLSQGSSSVAVDLGRDVERVGIIPLHSPSVYGYIVMAADKNPEPQDLIYLKDVAARLQPLVEESIEGCKLDEGFFVEIPAVDFAAWCKADGQFFFLKDFDDMAKALCIGFFPTPKPFPSARSMGRKNMSSIRVDDISTETEISFNAYLHMKKNGRYFNYIKKGRKMLPRQKETLRKRNIEDFHIKNSDIRNYKAYYAYNFLFDLILAFQRHKKAS